ncbi:hypothetical protein [Rhodococcus sp. NPDC004095]
MTDPIKAAMQAATEVNRRRVADSIRPATDAFFTSPSIRDVLDSFAFKNLMGDRYLMQGIFDAGRVSLLPQYNLHPDLAGIGDLASVSVLPFQQSVMDSIPAINDIWRQNMPDIMPIDSALMSGLIDSSQIGFGIQEVFDAHSLVPDFGEQIRAITGDLFNTQESWRELQLQTSATIGAIAQNSGVSVIAASGLGDSFGAEFADAMRTLVPQFDVFPDFFGLKDLADNFVDQDLLDAVEDQLASDPSRLAAFNVAVKTIRKRLKVSKETARKIVITTMYITSFAVTFYVLQYGPEDVSGTLSNFLTAGGFSVPGGAHHAINKAFKKS